MSEKYYKRLDNGQVAGVRFDTENALPALKNYYAENDLSLSPETQQTLRNAKIRITSTAAHVGDSKNQVKQWLNDTTRDNKYGQRTGKSPQGMRSIFSGIKQKVAALPSNTVLQADGATQDLHAAYSRILGNQYGDRFFRGWEGGNYVAPPRMHPSWISWLSKVLPSVTAPQTVLGASNLYDNIKQQGPTQGYMKWLGFDAQPRKWY